MSALKKIRGQPLLSPPGEGLYFTVVRERDVGLLTRALEDIRHVEGGGGFIVDRLLSEAHFCLRGLGYPHDITAHDRDLMKYELEHTRENVRGFEPARAHYFMAQIGFPQEVTAADWKCFDSCFSRQYNLNAHLARADFYLNAIGVESRLSPKEREDVQKIFTDWVASRRCDPLTLAEISYCMKKTCFVGCDSAGVEEVLKGGLEELRRSSAVRAGFIPLLYYSNQLFPPKETYDTTQIPPLKKYVK